MVYIAERFSLRKSLGFFYLKGGKESKEFLDDLTTRDQRMMFAVITMVHTADSKEQLDN